MAAQVVISNTVKLVVFCRRTDQTAMNVLYYRCDASTGIGGTTQDIADTWSPILAAAYKPLLTSSARYEGVQVLNISELPVAAAALSTVGNGPGLVNGEALPGQIAGLITKRSAFIGRSYRGRVYVPFPDETDNDVNGGPIVDYRTRLTNLANVMATGRTVGGGADTSSLVPVIANKHPIHTWPIWLTSSARIGWATQRRRGYFGAVNTIPF